MLKVCESCIKSITQSFKSSVALKQYHAQTQKKLSEIQKPIISCRRKEYDFYSPHQQNKLDEIKLASKGWHHKKSKGDFFILHMSDDVQVFDNDTTFTQTGLNNKLVELLEKQHILKPTLIQSKTIPIILSGKNCIIAAETGCGKTFAYLLPAINLIMKQKLHSKNTEFNSPLCLVLTPSRELALQIRHVAQNILNELGMSSSVIIGGGTKAKMLNPQFTQMDLLVATPGALSKLVTTGVYKTNLVRHVILDEADTLLDESFSEKLSHFLKRFPFSFSSDESSGVQLTLASATMPISLPDIIADVIQPDSLVKITTDQLHRVLPHVPQRFLRIGRSMKPSQLLHMVKSDSAKRYPVMIFSNNSGTCDWISMFLNENGLNCINLNGNMSLNLRKDRFLQFQRGDVNIISCTDVGSRGLDTIRVQHVINYNFPKHSADYVHRCGRTGRIGSPVKSHITNFIAGEDEIDLVQKMEMTIRKMQCLPNVNGNISGIIKIRLTNALREHV